MLEPVDEFAGYVRALRKAKGVTADQLSLSVDASRTYIGQWERGKTKTINREVLAKVAGVLKLSAAERQRLFVLAASREPGNAGIERPKVDLRLNVLEALVQRAQDIPQDVNPLLVGLEQTYGPCDAAAWLLADWAARSGCKEFQPSFVEWPDEFVENGFVRRRRHGRSDGYYRIPSPDEATLVALETTPNQQAMLSRPELSVNLWSDRLASVYRRWLFFSLERSQECARALSFWSLQYVGTTPVGTFRFSDPHTDDDYGVHAVTCDAIALVSRRRLTTLFAAGLAPKHKADERFAYISDRIDQWPRAFGFSTQEQLEYLFDNRHNATALAGHLQIVTDALYVLTRDCTLDAEWYVVDNYVPDMMYLGDGKPLDIANEEDREELIHRLQRIQRHIVKRLRSAPPSSDLPGIGPQCSATDIAKLPWEKFPMAEEDEAGPPSKRKAKKSTRSKSPGAKAAKLRATAKGTRSPKRKAKKKRK